MVRATLVTNLPGGCCSFSERSIMSSSPHKPTSHVRPHGILIKHKLSTLVLVILCASFSSAQLPTNPNFVTVKATTPGFPGDAYQGIFFQGKTLLYSGGLGPQTQDTVYSAADAVHFTATTAGNIAEYSAPAVCIFGGNIILAFPEGGTGINYYQSTDGITFGAVARASSGGHTVSSLTMTVLNNVLYTAWEGDADSSGAAGIPYGNTSTDGVNFTAPSLLNPHYNLSSGLSITTFNGGVYMVFTVQTYPVVLKADPTGTSYTEVTSSAGASVRWSGEPRLAVFNGVLYILGSSDVASQGFNQSLQVVGSNDGVSWNAVTVYDNIILSSPLPVANGPQLLLYETDGKGTVTAAS